MTRSRDLANLGSVNLSNTYATKTSPVFAGTANFSNASVIFNSASVSGLSSGGGATVNSNLLYNGAMQVHQRIAVATSANFGSNYEGYLTADRWFSQVPYLFGYGTILQTIENDAPTGSGFRKSLKHAYSSSDGIASGKYFWISQKLEGQDCQAIRKGTASARSLTLSFWVKSNLTGTYIAELVDVDNTRYVSQSYTINSSGTWEFKTVTFPPDTTGVLDNDNNESLRLNFWLRGGSNFSGGASLQTTWGTTGNTRAVGQVDLAATVGNYWQVTGVKLEISTSASEFVFKPFSQDLAECQRYYEKSYDLSVVPGSVTTNGMVMGGYIMPTGANYTIRVGTRYIVAKRAAGNVTIYDSAGNVGKVNLPDTTTNKNGAVIANNEFGLTVEGYAGATVTDARMYYHYVANAEL